MTNDILLIGGKGKTGRYLAKELAAMGVPRRIGTRRSVSEEEVVIDWTNTAQATVAFAGARAVYIVAPTHSSDHGTIVPLSWKKRSIMGLSVSCCSVRLHWWPAAR